MFLQDLGSFDLREATSSSHPRAKMRNSDNNTSCATTFDSGADTHCYTDIFSDHYLM